MNIPNDYLRFEDPTVLKFNFQINDDFDSDSTPDDTDISTLVEIPSTAEIDFSGYIPIYLTIFINDDDNNYPYQITAKIFTLFQVSELLSEESALHLLRTEGASILLSYLRPIISMMTSASGFPTLTLPTLDFSDSESNQ